MRFRRKTPTRKEIEEELDAITEIYQDTKEKLLDCESSCIESRRIHQSSTLVNAGIGRRSTKFRKYLPAQCNAYCFPILWNSKKSQQIIKGLIKSAAEFGFTKLNKLLQ